MCAILNFHHLFNLQQVKIIIELALLQLKYIADGTNI